MTDDRDRERKRYARRQIAFTGLVVCSAFLSPLWMYLAVKFFAPIYVKLGERLNEWGHIVAGWI